MKAVTSNIITINNNILSSNFFTFLCILVFLLKKLFQSFFPVLIQIYSFILLNILSNLAK